ncbi:hypothetical protein BHAOGJBA_1314 [Methylobacterium hispanicum]|uniref:Polyvalent protein metallopeptidase domain-containing protein n=1 Tax=Methylobacterium hispanicum TaxID=270350 RepID=A0AAV4ZIS7_9HYPH|nr:hypothetical protein [Methylobacterium hispanicum]GJD87809.1 hypothetical protein BHAOGJBA_1314 [Methylobacterium hispanicum]
MDKSEAYLDGWLAHAQDVGSDDNPHEERRQPRSHAQWTSGWCARFSAVKHGLDLTYDDAALAE